MGPERVTRAAETLGIADVAGNVGSRPAIALGGLRKGVTPLEQAAAFATFAAKGVYAQPYAIASIEDRDGRPVYSHRLTSRQAFDAKEVGVLNRALLSVVEQGTGTAARIGRPVAGKTWTTQNYGDAWFVGFVPQLSTAVWVGYPDRIVPMTNVHGRRVSGGSFPAQIWAASMREAVAGLPVQEVHTSPPESLSLRLLNQPPPPPPTSSTTTSSTSSTTTTTAPLLPAPIPTLPARPPLPPTTLPAPTTTAPRGTTTTTTPATTTTTKPQGTTTTSSSTTTTTTTGRSP